MTSTQNINRLWLIPALSNSMNQSWRTNQSQIVFCNLTCGNSVGLVPVKEIECLFQFFDIFYWDCFDLFIISAFIVNILFCLLLRLHFISSVCHSRYFLFYTIPGSLYDHSIVWFPSALLTVIGSHCNMGQGLI